MIVVEFERNCLVNNVRYAKGEIAGFVDSISDQLIVRGDARVVTTHGPKEKPSDTVPLKPIQAEPVPAAEEQTGLPRRDKMDRGSKRK